MRREVPVTRALTSPVIRILMSGSRMTLTVLMMMTLLPLMPGSGGTKQKPAISYMMSPANTVSCRDKDKRLLEEVENAQLAAHR